MKLNQQYETDRLILKPTSIEDAPFVFELMNSSSYLNQIGDRNIKSIGDAEKYIAAKEEDKSDVVGYARYTVIRKSDKMKVGTCGLFDRPELDGVDIGFAFLPEYTGKGYGFESADKMKSVGFNEFGLAKIIAITSKENISSQRLLKKLGLKHIGMTKFQDEVEALMLYEILHNG